MRARMQARLARILMAAVLVTTSVTGGGQCPCRFVNALRTPTPAPVGPAPAQPSACKCFRHGTGRDAPTHFEDGIQKPISAPCDHRDAPCDHLLAVGAAAVGSANERPETTARDWDTNSHLVSATQTHPQETPDSFAGVVGSSLTPLGGAHFIRYVHAFRC